MPDACRLFSVLSIGMRLAGCWDAFAFGRPGGDLLSRVLGRSTIGAEGFHGRVRDGIGWVTDAMVTKL